MISKNNITGVILAGGKSSRMGTDKGFLNLHGIPFAKYSIEAVAPLVYETVIVSNNTDYDVFKLKRHEDIIKDAGPLAGIYTALNQTNTDFILVLSCDIPLIKTEILEELINAGTNDYDVIQLVSKGRSMPLIALYHRRCEQKFYKLLQNGERKIGVALKNCRVKDLFLRPEQEIHTANINNPEELKILEHVVNH